MRTERLADNNGFSHGLSTFRRRNLFQDQLSTTFPRVFKFLNSLEFKSTKLDMLVKT